MALDAAAITAYKNSFIAALEAAGLASATDPTWIASKAPGGKFQLSMDAMIGSLFSAIIANLEVKGVPGATLSAVKNALFICNQVRFAAHSATEADSQIVELGVDAIISYGEKKTSEPQDSELSKNKNKQ